MLEKSCSSSMMRDPCKTGIDRVVAWRDNAMFGSEHRSVVLRIDSGIVMITMDFGISPGCYQVEGVKTLNYSGNSVVK